jgi:hypothetical protein
MIRQRKKKESCIIPVPNPDKEFHESWEPEKIDGRMMIRHPLNVPHPSRWVLFGPPGTGKTTMILNALVRQDPPFDRVFVIHVDGSFTKEYNKIKKFTKLTSIPSPEWWSGEEKTLVILDDLEYKQMSDREKGYLDRLFGYASTHKNISVMLTAQEGFNIPTGVRRCADMWVLYKNRDMDAVTSLARKGGLKKDDLHAIFDTYRFALRDSVWIDTTPDTPYPLRINGDQLISEGELLEIVGEYKRARKNKLSGKDSCSMKRQRSV